MTLRVVSWWTGRSGEPCLAVSRNRRSICHQRLIVRALRFIRHFCCDKENSFNLAGYLTFHVGKRQKDATLATNIPMDELLSENNCFWLS